MSQKTHIERGLAAAVFVKGPSFAIAVRPCSVLRFIGGGGGSGTSEAMLNKLRFS
jgi:hypothetical protein